MTPEFLATCQCIISHPSRPKFMAIKHSTGYQTPVVKVPLDASLGSNAQHVLEGIRNKYGLQTTLLRHVARFRDYQCVELELHGKDGRRMKAVWVGLEDYRRMRGPDESNYDPFVEWLQQKEAGDIPPQRPPWERHGWYQGAVHWINFQLDRLNIQATGSVAQRRALVHAGTILRVPTSQGHLYFKAAYDKAPREVALTRYLAERWPDVVGAPLAVDEARNWMLMPDYAVGERRVPTIEELVRVAAALGRLQVESIGPLEELRELGCQAQGVEPLHKWLERRDFAEIVPDIGEAGLSADERARLAALAPVLVERCQELAGYGVPETLVHPDFRAPNFFVTEQSLRVIDWENACIAPPFFALLKLLREDHRPAIGAFDRDPVVQAYLEPFGELADAATLLRALDLAHQLQHAWRLLRWTAELPYFEPGGVGLVNAQRFIVRVARELLAGQGD